MKVSPALLAAVAHQSYALGKLWSRFSSVKASSGNIVSVSPLPMEPVPNHLGHELRLKVNALLLTAHS